MPSAIGRGPERLGDYVLFPPFATGGNATVHLGRLVRGVGFERLVVVKRLHPRLAADAGAAERLLREARVSSRVRSPYVVPTLDVVSADGELCLVIEFVHGVTVGRLLELANARKKPMPPAVAVAIAGQVLRGLHAAHEATGEDGLPLELVHRDVSPHNVIVGIDGLARILDFGIAKALGHKDLTASTEIQGTLAYMAPEQLRHGLPVTRRVDIHAVGVVLWEVLTGMRLRPMTDVESLVAALAEEPPAPSARMPGLPPALDAIVLRALRRDPADRFPTAHAMLVELESAVRPASPDVVADMLELMAFDELDRIRELVARCERGGVSSDVPREPTPALVAGGDLVAGKYRVGEFIGSGAMGIVFAATHELLGTPVAIKVLQSDRLGDDKSMARMLREARASQRLTSPHVVSVLDVGMTDGLSYLVMERLHGTDLRAHLAERGPLPVDVAVLYALQACDALVEAHAAGIIHRDLKPANLFLTTSPDGRTPPMIKVLDFGIAKDSFDVADTASGSLTATTSVLGSPAYMAPEQIRSPKGVDARADVWALAVVLYELLTRALPFPGETSAAILATVSADGWIPIRSVRPDVPRELSTALERCFAKNPGERTPSMLAFASGLLPFAPPGYIPPERLRQAASAATHSPRRGRRTATAVGAAVAAAVIGLVGVGFAARNRSAPPVVTVATALPSAELPPAPPAASPTAFFATSPPVVATPPPVTSPSSPPRPPPTINGRRGAPRARPSPPPPAPRETAEAPVAPSHSVAPKLDPTAEFK